MEYRVCLFLDLLGFKAFVAGVHERPHDIERLSNLLEDLRVFGASAAWAKGAGFLATQFSDSLVVSFIPADQKPNDDALPQYFLARDIQRLLMKVTEAGFLVRGGAAVGPLHHTQQQVFGRALTDAYELEQQAVYPHLLFTTKAKEAVVKSVTGERADEANRLFYAVEGADHISMDYILYGTVNWWMRPSVTDFDMYRYCAALKDRLHQMQTSESCSVQDKFKWAATRYETVIDSLVGTPTKEPNSREHRWVTKFAALRL